MAFENYLTALQPRPYEETENRINELDALHYASEMVSSSDLFNHETLNFENVAASTNYEAILLHNSSFYATAKVPSIGLSKNKIEYGKLVDEDYKNWKAKEAKANSSRSMLNELYYKENKHMFTRPTELDKILFE
jgi:hypothetical protein